MGIHINLTEGRPITNDLDQIKSLINVHGFMHGKVGLRIELENRSIKQEHIEYEIRNQLNKYKELTNGEIPRHIDSHQHIHVHPMIVEIVARIAKQFGINYIRAPYDQMFLLSNIENLFYKDIIDQTKFAFHIFNKYSLMYSSYFFGLTTMGNQFTLKNIEKCFQLLEKYPKEAVLIELMCHPGYPSDPSIGGCGTGQPDNFSQSNERQHEFNVLSSMELKSLFYKYNIHLCIYDDIFQKTFLINKDMLNDDEVNVDANRRE